LLCSRGIANDIDVYEKHDFAIRSGKSLAHKPYFLQEAIDGARNSDDSAVTLANQTVKGGP
jgi:hypothetical protein